MIVRIEKIDSQNYWKYIHLQISIEQVRMMGDNRKEPCTFYPMNIMAQYAFNKELVLLGDTETVLLGFADDNDAIGFCSYQFINVDINGTGNPTWGYFITSYMIDKNFQRRNFGTYGMKLLIEYIKQNHSPEKIYIAVNSDNIPAKKLYLKSGFVFDKEYVKEDKNNHGTELNMFFDCT